MNKANYFREIHRVQDLLTKRCIVREIANILEREPDNKIYLNDNKVPTDSKDEDDDKYILSLELLYYNFDKPDEVVVWTGDEEELNSCDIMAYDIEKIIYLLETIEKIKK